MCVKQSSKSERGFTLIEMAVVLMLFGVVMGGGLVGFAHFSHQIKTKSTEDKFELVLNALSIYAQKHKRLPCPADPGAAAATQGAEMNGGNCFNTASANAMYDAVQGVVPWRELGLPENVVRDGWGRFFTYKPAPQLTANYLDATMQNVGGANGLDVHDACRSPSWYASERNGTVVTHTHFDRGKALFCCNRAPNTNYLTSIGQPTALPGNWRDQSIAAAGSINAGGLGAGSTTPVGAVIESTHAWRDDDADNTQIGDFDNPDHGLTNNGPDAPLSRSTGPAITLISHGGNGFMSFMTGKPRAQRLLANYAAGAVVQNAPMGDDEQLNIWPPQVAAGTVKHPKSITYDELGRLNGASDDHVAFMRTDQLYSRVGSASCLRPANFGGFDDICIEDTYDDVIYLLDTSGSMGSRFQNTNQSRIDVAKEALLEVMRRHMEREFSNDEDFDDIGYTGFDNDNAQYTDDEAYLGRPFFDDMNDDGVIDANDDYDGDGFITDADIPHAVDAYMAAHHGMTDNPGVIDYDADGNPALWTNDDLVEARVTYGSDKINAIIDNVDDGGCTPVSETAMVQTETLIKSAEIKLCQQLVADSAVNQSLVPTICDDNGVRAEYDADPDAFVDKYKPEPFNPDEVEPNAVVMLSDGNDNCSDPRSRDFDRLPISSDASEQVYGPNGDQAFEDAWDDTTPRRGNCESSPACLHARYTMARQAVDNALANFNATFAAFGVNKQIHFHIVDVVGNESLDNLTGAGGQRIEIETIEQLIEEMLFLTRTTCPANT